MDQGASVALAMSLVSVAYDENADRDIDLWEMCADASGSGEPAGFAVGHGCFEVFELLDSRQVAESRAAPLVVRRAAVSAFCRPLAGQPSELCWAGQDADTFVAISRKLPMNLIFVPWSVLSK